MAQKCLQCVQLSYRCDLSESDGTKKACFNSLTRLESFVSASDQQLGDYYASAVTTPYTVSSVMMVLDHRRDSSL